MSLTAWGTGDSFAAGFLYSLIELKKGDIVQCAPFGNATAAYVCSIGKMSEVTQAFSDIKKIIEGG